MFQILPTISDVYADALDEKPIDFFNFENYNPEHLEDPGKFKLIRLLGFGKFGNVFHAINTTNNEDVAIKVLKPIREFFVKREIIILRELQGGVNIIPLLGISFSYFNPFVETSLIFPFADERFDRHYLCLDKFDTRYYLHELLKGLNYCHSKGIMHRDIKPQNIMVNLVKRKLQIIDWGLAEFYRPLQQYSSRVASRSYKAPELLIQYPFYDYAMDMWSVGCLLASMLFKKGPFFAGYDSNHQLLAIVSVLGTEGIDKYTQRYRIPICPKLKVLLRHKAKRNWEEFVHPEGALLLPDHSLDLLERLLKYNHKERISAVDALNHPMFYMIEEQERSRMLNLVGLNIPGPSDDDLSLSDQV